MSALRPLAPVRPVLGFTLLDPEYDYRFRVDAVHRVRLFLRHVAGGPLAVHQQAFRLTLLHRLLAMLEALASCRLVRPGARAAHVWRPQQIAAAAVGRLDRVGPQRHHYRAVGLAQPAPAGAPILQPDAACLERAGAGDQAAGPGTGREFGAGTRARARRCTPERFAAQRGHLRLVQALGVFTQPLDVLHRHLRDALEGPLVGALQSRALFEATYRSGDCARGARARASALFQIGSTADAIASLQGTTSRSKEGETAQGRRLAQRFVGHLYTLLWDRAAVSDPGRNQTDAGMSQHA